MAYTSDLRLKNVLKDIHLYVVKELGNQGFNELPSLRVFDESQEDAKLFSEGGLTFKDPKINYKYGSNDGAWVYKGSPILIVEGTFGTERGQFGDGQLNRFSHSLGACVNGHTGVTIIPFKGESYSKTGKTIAGMDTSIRIKYATVHKGFIKGALNSTKKHRGNFFVMDVYSSNLLVNLIIEKFKAVLKRRNNLEDIEKLIIKQMEKEVYNYEYASRSKGIIGNLYNNNNYLISNFSRAYTQNFEALTDSSKRDGHGLLGKCLIESYLSEEENYYAIFLRMSKKDLQNLSQRQQKEFSFINNSKYINICCFDDLEFNDKKLKKRLEDIRKINLFRHRKNELLREIQESFNEGSITLKSH
jgi:hypothetical protein